MKIKRLQEQKLKKCLEMTGAVQVTGPKWSGKTFLSKKLSNSQYYMQELGSKNLLLLDEPIQSNTILNGSKPRLIDEWQVCAEVWDKIRFVVDQSNNETGQYILTGSTTPVDKDKIIHSGAGRFSKVKMNTLTFYEANPDECKYSIKDLFDGKLKQVSGESKFKLSNIVDYMLLGGWPNIIANNKPYNKEFYASYIDFVINSNTLKISNIRNSSHNFSKLLTSIARINSSQINKSTIVADTNLNIRTVEKYIEVLESLDLIFYIYPWNCNARSKNIIRTKPKLYMCDPSLAFNILNIDSKEKAYTDMNTLGLIFENQVMKDLSVYADYLGARLFYYRDKNDNEVDAVIELDDGRWGIIEIKMKNFDLEEESEKLLRFKTYYNFEKSNIDHKESFAVIVTAGEKAYTLNNGVHVIPFSFLKP